MISRVPALSARPSRFNAMLVVAALAACLLAPGRAQAAAPACTLPPDMLEEARPLQAAARALELGRLRILVIGSASVLRPDAAEPETAWPARLQAALARRYPDGGITLVVRGARGASVTDNLPRLVQALREAPPALVVWQAGTAELARGMDPAEMTEVMREGLEAIRRAGADVIIMDQQYSRFLRANANVEPYRDKLRLLAGAMGAALVPRYDLMRHWVDTGALDLERAPRGDRAAALERLNACLGEAVAQMIVRGLSEAR
jgi:acyl-CoA thioesterase I